MQATNVSSKAFIAKLLRAISAQCCFWLKNRRPSEWRDVQNIAGLEAHYILSDKPMTEQEWIAARADAAKTIEH